MAKISKKLLNKLDKQGVKYEIVEHRPVYTAYDAAQTMKLKVNQVAKSLLVKAGKEYYMAHLPADRDLNLKKLAKVLDVKKVTLPKEKQVTKTLKIKPGKMSAFSFMYDIPSVVDKNLLKPKKIVLSSGVLDKSILMTPTRFMKTGDYQTGVFSKKKKFK